ncbi:hypothetical protein TRVL_01400 [Trypanosoma vivax]|nr:hypothetical protein TRVL_01400 [Trypanosoma vivax]
MNRAVAYLCVYKCVTALLHDVTRHDLQLSTAVIPLPPLFVTASYLCNKKLGIICSFYWCFEIDLRAVCHHETAGAFFLGTFVPLCVCRRLVCSVVSRELCG